MYKYLYIFYRLQDFYAHQGYIYFIKKYSNILKYVFHLKEQVSVWIFFKCNLI